MNILIDFVLHIDKHLVSIVNTFGDWTYLILFFVIFIETAAVILPFLPGDSLLFSACALAANPQYGLNVWIFVALFLIAPITGDTINFYIGRKVGNHITPDSFLGRFIKPEKLKETEQFFEKHGGISITLARFMPIVRTFCPFVCASSGYSYHKFLGYNVLGAVLWVILCCASGFYFGNFPVVKEHFSLIVIAIILVTLLPAIIGAIRGAINKKKATK